MRIRKMVIDDYDEVYKLWMSCSGMGLNNLDDSKEGISKFLLRNPDTCFVSEDKEINGVNAMQMLGLKKTTFYKLKKQYEQELEK